VSPELQDEIWLVMNVQPVLPIVLIGVSVLVPTLKIGGAS